MTPMTNPAVRHVGGPPDPGPLTARAPTTEERLQQIEAMPKPIAGYV
jgi:hypothetical protein